MRLIGLLDSPYVRRVAIALHLLELPFDHSLLSVFRDVEALEAVNPILKVPTLEAEDGTALMDSTLILQHVERLAPAGRRLAPEVRDAHLRALRISGLALAACEKTVQLVYELNLRPAEKHHAPWLDRVGRQRRAAFALLEAEMPDSDGWLVGDRPYQADIDAAVAWDFATAILAEVAPEAAPAPADHPRLAAFSARAEALPAFRAAAAA